MNKRGSVSDMLLWVALFFGIVVVVIVLTLALAQFNTVIQNEADVSADTKTVLSDYRNNMPGAMDGGLVFMYVAAHISIIFLGLMLRSVPLLFPILFLALIVLTIMAGFVSNAFDEIASDSALQSFADEYPKTSWLLDNFMLVTLVFGFIDILVFVGLGALFQPGGRGI